MSRKLTKKVIDGFKYEGDGKSRDIRWDNDVRGLGVRVYPSGKKSFVISFRSKGKKQLMVIGQYGQITLDQARKVATQKFGQIAEDKNPLEIKKATVKKTKWTVRYTFREYLNRYAKPNTKTWAQVQRFFDKDVLNLWGKRAVEDIKREDVVKLVDDIVDRGSPVMANRGLAYLKKFFNWCVERGLIEYSPAHNVSKPSRERSRERVLSDDEIRDIWHGCENIGYPFGHVLKLCLLTGQRKGEVAHMLWRDVDLENKVWTLAQEQTKSGRAHTVPLSDMAIEIIQDAPKLGDYVFSATGKRPFEHFTRGHEKLDKIIRKARKERGQVVRMTHWTNHDLRRTCASNLAKLETPPHIIEKILNHSSGTFSGVAAVYNRYEYMDEMREALNVWSNNIKTILDIEI